MPKKTNHFQQLVYLIQHQLADRALVKNSVMVDPKSDDGEKREVDIVITSKVGNINFIIGIECIDKNRVADVTWVEQMHAKHQKLKIDKTILISKSGYTRQAKVDAKNYGIDLLKWSKAGSKNWDAYINLFRNSKLVEYSFQVAGYSFNINDNNFTQDTLTKYRYSIFIDEEKNELPIIDYLTNVLIRGDIVCRFFEDFNKSFKNKDIPYILVRFTPPEKIYIKADSNKFYSIASAEIKVYIKEDNIKFNTFDYDNIDSSSVLHSKTKNIFSKSKKKNEEISICLRDVNGVFQPSLYIPDYHGAGEQTFDLIVTEEGHKKSSGI